MTAWRPPYPLVISDGHPGDPLPGYLVCPHAFNDPEIDVVVAPASKEDVGIVTCEACAESESPPTKDMKLICAHAALEMFEVPL